MYYIKKIRIMGYKGFKDSTIEFNKGKNIIVGINEIGKSTILESIGIVLYKAIYNKIDNSLERYFNNNNKIRFYENKTIDSLPEIIIELFLDFEDEISSLKFSGLNYINHQNEEQCGIKFEYKFDRDFSSVINLNEYAEKRIIPIEYYKAEWQTFSNLSYKPQFLPFKYLFIDNSNNRNDLFGNYAKSIYLSKIDNTTQLELSGAFNLALGQFKESQKDKLNIDDTRLIGLDANKTHLMKLLDIYESDISIQDMGKGKENLVKTEIALNNSMFDIILIEEPENHLSYTNTRKLLDLINSFTNTQIIITSHSSVIASHLDLKNIIWLNNDGSHSLNDLTDDTAEYFNRLDNLDILRFILAEKCILVEGAVEYILLPQIIYKLTGTKISEWGIDIISMGSISHERYREIASILNKRKIVTITDNDKKPSLIGFNIEDNFAVFRGTTIDDWTLEAAFYNCNNSYFDEQYKDRKTEAKYNGEECPKALAHMLKNKTENAIFMATNIENIEIPNYIQEAIKWINE